jgi:MFS family permease
MTNCPVARDENFPSLGFRLYWAAAAVSGLGTYVTLLALQALVVLTLDGSATDVGWLNSARWLPYLVVGLVVGAVVDRRRRLPIMVTSDVAQAILLMTIPLLSWVGLLSFPVLLVIVLGYGSASVVNAAAAMSLLPRLVEPRDLQRAHARIDGTDAGARTAGPALGGLLVSALSAPFAVVLDALSYMVSALTLSRINVTEPTPRAGSTVRGLLSEVLNGARWIYRGSGLTALAISTHGWFVGNAVVGVVLAPYALDMLDLTAFQFGIIGAVGGVGAILGAAVTTWVGRRLGTGRTIVGAHIITTVAVLVMIIAGSGMNQTEAVTVLAGGQGFYGLAMGLSNSHEMSYRQLLTPDELQARTNTTLHSLNRAVMVVIAPLAGLLADTWGIRPTLLLAAGTFGLVAVGLAATFRHARAPV